MEDLDNVCLVLSILQARKKKISQKTNKQTNNQTETENIQRKKKAIFSKVLRKKNMKDKQNYDAIFLPLATRNSSCSFILIF